MRYLLVRGRFAMAAGIDAGLDRQSHAQRGGLLARRVLQGIAGGCLPPMLIIVALRYLPPKAKLYG
ncbi:hypothetical protein PPH41_35030, partial [Burkholderia gladioli]|nr:hypothetical protein [Burkholderia gladioli]